ncbi:MAG TPA: amidohydrolase [Bacillus bacterium]|uniref:amidohydrolase n=1 Tax=Siminovitchia fordii TaxID=254759 RepID=UPI0003606AB8|nr:amidohydrolase [Siminovitchia fordii]HBZ08968.1 amidohydrolase [Bacillus sp. (in: firmicutes)]
MIQADLVIYNANVLTLDEQNTRAGSLASYQGKITGIWPDERPPDDEIIKSDNFKEIDLNGATLIPGFIDTHNHILMYGQQKHQVDCRSPFNKNIKDIQQRLTEAAQQKNEYEWIIGYGYDDSLLEEMRHPTKKDLDAINTKHPIFIRHISGHLAVTNSSGLQMAGITKDTPQPEGGHIEKDSLGEPTGVLFEPGAMNLVSGHIPLPDRGELIQILKEANNDYLAEGITTNTDAGIGLFNGEEELDIYLQAIKENPRSMKMRLMILNELLIDNGPFQSYTATELDDEIQEKTNGKAKLDSAKIFQDGSIQGLTGALRKPYHCDDQLYGELIYSQETINHFALDFHNRGFRVATHGNGDRAIGSIIEAYEHAIKNGGERDHRHRIEHVQTATEEDLKKMSELDIAASFFINHVYYWGDRHRNIFLGPDRAKRLNPLKEADNLNILYTLHSDCPITPISPLFSVWAAVNRVTSNGNVLGAEQKIDVETALKTMTIYGAKLNFEENEKGTIEVGKAADFAILEEDPTRINPMKIKDIHVLATYIDGELVFEKESLKVNE